MTNRQMRLLSLSLMAVAFSVVACFFSNGKDIPEIVLASIFIAYVYEYVRSIRDGER